MSPFPPATQQMTADSLVDAAVRRCDELLSSPTVTLQVGMTEEFDVVTDPGYLDWTSRSGRFPITAGDDKNTPPVLYATVVVPKYDEWTISITTADGQLVARTSPYAPTGGHGAPIFPPAKPGVWVEWGGAHHGHIDLDFTKKMALVPCCPIATHNSVGPTEAVSVTDDTLSAKYVCTCVGASLLCFGLPCVFAGFCCCPQVSNVVNRATGERLVRHSRGSSQSIELSLEGMNAEQRRLTLLAYLFEHAQGWSSQPHRPDGGGAC